MGLDSTTETAAPRAESARERKEVAGKLGARLALAGRLGESTTTVVGLSIVLFWVAMAILAPVIAPYPPNATDVLSAGHPTPSAAHWLGTDHLGRDILSRLLWGARRVLTVAPIAVLSAAAVGTLLGLCAGYFGGIVDLAISRVADILLSFPVIILYMIVLAMFGSSALNIVLVIAITKAPIIARIVRGLTLDLRNREYVAAAKMRGESSLYIMLVEILPNARGPLIVDMCLRMGYTTITIGVLGFLGIGLPPPDPDWGGMVKDTYGMMSVWPHMSLIPCAAISSLVVGFNLLAIGLRETALRE
ncbi:MAG TPA: ABC transporter permease [Stellaceae bacterium]|nr:ABC transporter permease [Stellaceae bacterium]